MNRLPYLRRDELGPAGQALWDGLVDGRDAMLVGEHGGLVGPFNAFVTAPDTGKYLSSLGAKVRFGTSLERRLSEIAIITTGARWQAEFEWWAHARMAVEHGVAQSAVGAIGCGQDPGFEAADERAVYAAAHELSHTGRLRSVCLARIVRTPLPQQTADSPPAPAARRAFSGSLPVTQCDALCSWRVSVRSRTVPASPEREGRTL